MTGENEKFRPIETAPEWNHEVFDTCAAEDVQEDLVNRIQELKS